RVQTLDEQWRELDSQMLVIDDADGPTSIAGIMGGARSEVASSTTRVLMEVANWDGPNIHRTSWKLALRSEASARFEKGLAPEQAMDAQAVAAKLMVEVCGARLVPGTIDVGGEGRLRRRAADALVGRGLHEVVGWSFTDPGLVDRLRLGAEDARRRVVALRNPMSSEHSVLRTTLLGSLLDIARHNVARGFGD